MLREYINRKIGESEELIIDLESDIRSGRNRKKELKKLIEILEDENNDGSEIFSPRNHREQNLDKLKHYREELEQVTKEIENRLDKLNETKKKRDEYKSMLAETEKIYQEKEKYENIDYQIKNNHNKEKQVKTEHQAGSQEEQQPEDDKESHQVYNQPEQQSGDDKKIEYIARQQARDQAERQDGNQNEDHAESYKEKAEDRQTGDWSEAEGGEQFNAAIKQQTNKNLMQVEERTEDMEKYEEQKAVPDDAMDTKIIIQKSIEEMVKRIESERDRKPEQLEQEHEEKLPKKYEGKQAKIQKGNRVNSRGDLRNIEVKSAELIVLESERKKEKEFLEKVKKEIDLCFVYAGNRSKCRNELIKVKRMIESYISSIEL